MSGAPTLPLTMPLSTLRRHIRFTITSLLARSWGKAWVTLFEAEVKKVDTHLVTETQLVDTLDDAETGVGIADTVLNRIAIHTNDTAKLYYFTKNLKEVQENLFGDHTPAEFIKPLLSEQLEGMRSWPGYLKGLLPPLMQAIAPKVETALKAADTAVTNQTAAEAALQNFRSLTHALQIHKINELFQGLLGEAHTQAQATGEPETQGLFLLTEQRRRRRAAKLTLSRAQTEVTTLQHALDAAKQDLADLQQIAAEEEQARLRRIARDERIANLNKQNRAIESELAALEKERDKDK